MPDLVEKARQSATSGHQRIDQRRKYTGQPYEVHLKAVAELVGTVSADPDMLAAAWLHDTVEDTPITIEALESEFGPGAAQLVAELTDASRPSDGNRAQRKAIDRAKLAKASPQAQTIKLADYGFSSKGAAKRVLKEVESLRNNLAHAQDIVSHDWAQIARLAQNFFRNAWNW